MKGIFMPLLHEQKYVLVQNHVKCANGESCLPFYFSAPYL